MIRPNLGRTRGPPLNTGMNLYFVIFVSFVVQQNEALKRGASTMADKPKITFSTNPNPRNRALIDGLIPIDGYDLEYVGDKYSAGEIHYRFMQGEFDVAEMSTATLMRAKEKGKRFLALPVFFQRGPRQRNIFYCEGKLKHPSELKGKTDRRLSLWRDRGLLGARLSAG